MGVKISALPVVTSVTDATAKIPLVEGGATSAITADNLAADSVFSSRYGAVTDQQVWVPYSQFVASFGAPAITLVSPGITSAFALDSASTEQIETWWGVPNYWLTCAFDLHWINLGAGAGAVRLAFIGAPIAAGSDVNSDAFTEEATVTAAAERVKKITTLRTGQSLAVARDGHMRLNRNGADAADTLGNDIGVLGLMIRRLT